MVFNILIDNTDDHEKNHSLLRQPDGSWLLSPAYDIVPAANGLGYQAMLVGEAAAESSLENALSQARAFGLRPGAARTVAEEVARCVNGWKDHFLRLGVRAADVDALAQYIDAGNPGRQRHQALRGRHS